MALIADTDWLRCHVVGRIRRGRRVIRRNEGPEKSLPIFTAGDGLGDGGEDDGTDAPADAPY